MLIERGYKLIIVIGVTAILTHGLGVPICSNYSFPNIQQFTYTVNGTQDRTTQAYICHDNQYLYVKWINKDTEVISTYSNCNDPLYNEDAVEIFIATTGSYPLNYFEFQVSPKGNLFIADITNPSGKCSNLQTKYYACTFAEYSGKIIQGGWEGHLKISLSFIGRGSKLTKFKGNLFRIDKSSTQPTRYLSYIPTMNSPPCFHQPAHFTEFQLLFEE